MPRAPSTGRVAALAAVAALVAPVSGCDASRGSATRCCDIEITATVPEGTGAVYVSGNWPNITAYFPDAFPMSGEGRERRVVINVPEGYPLEYRFTLGGWDAQGSGAGESSAGHYIMRSAVGASARHEIVAFRPGPPPLDANGRLRAPNAPVR